LQNFKLSQNLYLIQLLNTEWKKKSFQWIIATNKPIIFLNFFSIPFKSFHIFVVKKLLTFKSIKGKTLKLENFLSQNFQVIFKLINIYKDSFAKLKSLLALNVRIILNLPVIIFCCTFYFFRRLDDWRFAISLEVFGAGANRQGSSSAKIHIGKVHQWLLQHQNKYRYKKNFLKQTFPDLQYCNFTRLA
jgi:hypothetical protein